MAMSKEKLISLLCKVLPFIFIGAIVLYLALHAIKGDITVFCMIIPLFVFAVLPLLVGIGYGIQSSMLVQSLRIPQEIMMSNPQIAELYNKGSKWFRIGLFNLFTIFLITALIAWHFSKKEYMESPYHVVKINQPTNLSNGSNLDAKLTVLNKFARPLFKIPMIAIAIAAIFIAVSFFYKTKHVNKNPFRNPAVIIPVILFIVPMVTLSTFGNIIHYFVLKEVKLFLNNVSPSAKVAIDGKIVNNGQEIIQTLSRVAIMPAHHSDTFSRFRVEITDANQGLVLDLEQDKDIHQEYWIFYPGYGYTMENEIGRIRTPIFDNYKVNTKNP